MAEEVKKAPEVEAKETEKAETKAKPEVKADGKKDVKVGEALKTVEEKKESRMVPEAVLIEYKKEAKEFRKEINDLKATIEAGASKKEVAADIKSLAEESGIDADVLQKLTDSIRKGVKADAEAEVRPLKEAEQASKLDKVFNENYDKTLSEMPEYAKLVNKEVIRSLAFDPRNADKTFAQIFESSYGHLVTGKKTLETTKARGGKSDTTIDFARAQRDGEYFKEIMADPELKREYNKDLHKRIPS